VNDFWPDGCTIAVTEDIQKNLQKKWLRDRQFFSLVIMEKSRGFGNHEKASWLLVPDWLIGQAYHFCTSLASQIIPLLLK